MMLRVLFDRVEKDDKCNNKAKIKLKELKNDDQLLLNLTFCLVSKYYANIDGLILLMQISLLFSIFFDVYLS